MRRLRRLAVLPLLAMALVLALPLAAHAQDYDKTQQAWLNGHPVQIYVKFPSGPPDPTTPTAFTYITAPQDPAHPQDPGGVYPPIGNNPDPFVVPAQDQTISRWVPASHPAECFGAFAVRGPNATAANVHTRVDPNGSGIELAYEYRLLGHWIPLTSNLAVDLGIKLGRLTAQPILPGDTGPSYGGPCWTGPLLP